MLNLRQTSKLSCVNRCLQGVLMRSSGPSVPPWCNHAGDRRALHTLGNHMSFCRGNIESWNRLDWERPLRSPSPTINPTLPSPPLNHVTESQNHRITESQNHRITESQHGRGEQGPLWVTQSNPLPKQGHPEQAAEDLVQAGLEYLQRRRLHNLPGQPVPRLCHPQSEISE